ncbi:relaxase/mobilization nuclease domain-containing protein [Ectobacillus funiculus]
MATIQLSTTKVANRLLSYAEKRAQERSGLDCPAEYAKSQFKATRELWGKTEGIQAHHVIQSFKPGEVTPELANQIGQDLAREIAKGYEAVVYTHTDKEHIHNHIVINSVSFEDGKKYQAHGNRPLRK